MLPAGVLLLVLIAAAGLFATDGARVIRFRYPMDYGEGPLLDQTMRLGRLESIYRVNPTSPPYTVSNYPPVYPLALSPLGRVWGPTFWYGRLPRGSAPLLRGFSVSSCTPSRAIRRPP